MHSWQPEGPLRAAQPNWPIFPEPRLFNNEDKGCLKSWGLYPYMARNSLWGEKENKPLKVPIFHVTYQNPLAVISQSCLQQESEALCKPRGKECPNQLATSAALGVGAWVSYCLFGGMKRTSGCDTMWSHSVRNCSVWETPTFVREGVVRNWTDLVVSIVVW